MHELDEDVVVVEHPPEAEAIDVWVMDATSVNSDRHRSLVIDLTGEVVGDTEVGDNE